ncbi:hypothetical protein BX616_006787, partial [Lobosporangium transversale]
MDRALVLLEVFDPYTILYMKVTRNRFWLEDIPGLEVQLSRTDKDASWISVPVIPGTILINIGDHVQIEDTKLDPVPSPLIPQEMRAEAVEFEECRNMTAGEYVKWRLERSFRLHKERSMNIQTNNLFTSDPKECAQQIYEASRNVGFFYLKNHGVSQDSINRMFKCSKRFFQGPLQSKNRYLMKDNIFGYAPVKSESLDPESQSRGDLKESFDIIKHWGRCEPINYFAQSDTMEQKRIEAFYKDLHSLATYVLQCFAIALKIPESAGGKHFFDKSHEWDPPSHTNLRFLHYPPQESDPRTPLAG